MEFKGTKGKWFIWRENLIITDYNTKEDVICIKPQIKNIENWKANALLISKAPEHLQELINEIELLKRIKKQLDDLGGSMEFEVEERIEVLEQLIKEATEL